MTRKKVPKKELIHQFSTSDNIPPEFKEFWVEQNIFRINKDEIAVFIGDYLVIKNNRLYYFPKNLWESYLTTEFMESARTASEEDVNESK